MDKYQTIKKSLEENTDVEVVSTEIRTNLLGWWSQKVDFLVAPTVGLYKADDLKVFMDSLVPELKHGMIDEFHERVDYDHLRFGKLYFDENIGKMKKIDENEVEIRFNDSDFTTTFSFRSLKSPVDDRVIDRLVKDGLHRRTWVSVYPNTQYVRDLLSGNLPERSGRYETTISHVKRYSLIDQYKVRSLVPRFGDGKITEELASEAAAILLKITHTLS